MTNKPKSMQEKKDEAAEKYCNFRLEKEDSCVWVADRQGFKAGWDARDKIADEALKVAVQALDSIVIEYMEDKCDIDYSPHLNPAFRMANEALTKIRELMGEK
jgi:hypothetical protein